jgi:CheY-like chemotaxis protein
MQRVPKKLRVLVVEDNATTMKIMHRLLEQNFGYGMYLSRSLARSLALCPANRNALVQQHIAEVYMAGSVEEALRIASQHQFDILLSDIGLPDGTGTEKIAAVASSNEP